MSGAGTGTGTRSQSPDRLCADAVELARDAAAQAAYPHPLGEYLGAVAEGDRLVTHLFASEEPGYPGWHWGVTVARAARARYVTVDEVTLMPGSEALLAPEWVPWSERLRPGDLGPGDLLPAESDDPRLDPGFAGPGEEIIEERAAEEGELIRRGGVADIAGELGLGRRRVLSWYGLQDAADRWEEGFGPESPMAQAAPASCLSCGFLMPMAGALRQAFGVCANEFSPADGHVVSLAYGCGAHSEAAVTPRPAQPAPPVIDHLAADPL
ncbi:DUF3027 domain-containing protein [Streptomyces sp. NBC_01803]|uniref:DUF3027 domain-containing protein n=1 Tax=Streptomyces sp. NBC_01803 TaxID=2975946 RepID=UPI002DDAC06F|nr:DUF3027 domain-containing protein [Streptomyces sp. NBC_01803]WSA44767.1 DUF3027 domain-containing protein [Streptomyces sp. NBC_01803]